MSSKTAKPSKKPAKKPTRATNKKYTNSELAQLNQLFRSPSIGDLQVAYKTYLAIKGISKQVEDALKPVAETEQKYLADGKADEGYQEFVAGQNQLRKDKPDDLVRALAEHAEANSHLTVAQRERTAGFQAALDAESDIKIELLTEDDVPDLFIAELAASEWEVLSLVISTT